MCTVSIIPLSRTPGAYRLVTNRDEQRSRPEGEPPAWRMMGGIRALAPRDPVGGGTWIATTESGLTLCLLNGNLEPPPFPPASPRSRGLLIGDLIALNTVDDVLGALCAMDLSNYPPFRLVVVEPGHGADASIRIADAFWNRHTLTQTPFHPAPVCFVSSGLGDSRAAPRLPLFDEWFGDAPSPELQDAFHRHAWPDRPEISVCMSRADARTVSITTVQVVPAGNAAHITVDHMHVPDASPVSLAFGSGRG